ncbi:hypothetical protein DPX16_17401 [Anabarilius grahami]|uniref:Retrotransposon gag domain-containing protein n=1 Tax=Anabarilius grahami TaxID=495550 RepID=A0A3N0XYW2_ANAGA|nr:hypothetical protein DPX16_17401 [Anabarilius grahami]
MSRFLVRQTTPEADMKDRPQGYGSYRSKRLSLMAEDRLCGLRQKGWPLERYVKEFLEVSYQVGWPDASLNACFLMGLDEDTIRYREPACEFSLVESINLVLYLNCSNVEVEEVKVKRYPPHPVPSETNKALPAHLTPVPFTYRSSGPVHSWLPVFPCGQKWASNSADLGAKVADPMSTSVRSAMKSASLPATANAQCCSRDQLIRVKTESREVRVETESRPSPESVESRPRPKRFETSSSSHMVGSETRPKEI